jgi:hypothetical protein
VRRRLGDTLALAHAVVKADAQRPVGDTASWARTLTTIRRLPTTTKGGPHA